MSNDNAFNSAIDTAASTEAFVPRRYPHRDSNGAVMLGTVLLVIGVVVVLIACAAWAVFGGRA